jgi:glutaryl-CoA dehydrogenase
MSMLTTVERGAETSTMWTTSTGDLYSVESVLDEPDRQLVCDVRSAMETYVAPIIDDYWARAEFPFEILPRLRELNIAGLGYSGYGCAGRSRVLEGLVTMELARVDCSVATFMGVHAGLAMGSIYLCGSEEQKRQWLPSMARLESIGAFGLTEPDVGSGAAGGLTTTARRDGNTWVLNGEKKWIGNATFADLTVIWARDVEDNQVKGFLVERGTPGFSTTRMEGKIALRAVQNARILLSDCRVAESQRLPLAKSFRNTADVLRMTRASVAWQAVGCAMGAYELALQYAKHRSQFGRPIAGFQLVQDLLVRMLSNVTAAQCLALRLSQLQDSGAMTDEQASLAKAFCTVRARETVGWARELFGGNGILLEHQVGRFVADAEAIYSYEGTREINTLIVGRAITGHSAFV